MSSRDDSDRPADRSANGDGVLSNLPRTRPQRSSPRRAAARGTVGAAKASAGERPAKPPARAPSARESGSASARESGSASARGSGSTRNGAAAEPKARGAVKAAQAPAPARKASARKRPEPKPSAGTQPPPPRQGYETETTSATGPVQPPGGAELVASAAEIIGELAKAGLSRGERVLKDLFSHFPLS
jgi:hypothetical protein